MQSKSAKGQRPSCNWIWAVIGLCICISLNVGLHVWLKDSMCSWGSRLGMVQQKSMPPPTDTVAQLPLPAVVNETAQSAANRTHSDPVAESTELRRCLHTLGDWCQRYQQQTPITYTKAPRGDKACPKNCNDIGVCDYDTGMCYCPSGFGGVDCTTPRKRPCLHMGPDNRDEGWAKYDEGDHTRCAGICDDNYGTCWCPPESKYGHDLERIPGQGGGRIGRTMLMCFPSTDVNGSKVAWNWGPWPYEYMYGSDGWCDADEPTHQCPCRLDGLSGQFCQHITAQYCINQCSGHGKCIQGFCQCTDAWYGQDCSRRRKNLPLQPGEHHNPKNTHLKHLVIDAPSAQEPVPAKTRLRPLIYVYELAPEFNTDIMQIRFDKHMCTWRAFDEHNKTALMGWNAYALEPLLHDLLLNSRHRTYDPEEADFFYVPIYSSCMINIYNWGRTPKYPPGTDGPRPIGAAYINLAAKEWVQQQFPYWNRSGGRDHVFLMTHDEGACYAHIDVWSAMFITHWGKLDFPHFSHTSYGHDNYSREAAPHANLPDGWLKPTSLSHPCYHPQKDLVVPVFKDPSQYAKSMYLGTKQVKRDILLFFKGDIGLKRLHDVDCLYSRCVRQTIYKHAKKNGWADFYILDREDNPLKITYSEYLARSVFCLVAAGDGWSARFEDAILNGCIPVVVLDNTHAPFETVLDWEGFGIRFPERQMHDIRRFLLSISKERVAQLQQGLERVWHRFRYNSHPIIQENVRQVLQENRAPVPPNAPRTDVASPLNGVDDAFDTILQWLHSRIPTRSAQLFKRNDLDLAQTQEL